MKLFSWNVAHRSCCEAQVHAMVSRTPNVIALQEITTFTARQLVPLLTASAFPSSYIPVGATLRPARAGHVAMESL